MGWAIRSRIAEKFCESISDREFIVFHVAELAAAWARALVAGGFQRVVGKSCGAGPPAQERRAPQELRTAVLLALENRLRVRHRAPHPSWPSQQSHFVTHQRSLRRFHRDLVPHRDNSHP